MIESKQHIVFSTHVQRMPRLLLMMATLLFFQHCAAQKKSVSSYEEDVSFLHPLLIKPSAQPTEPSPTPLLKPSVNITETDNAKIDAVLDSISSFKRSQKFMNGFSIQIYSGQNRNEAARVNAEFVKYFPSVTSRLQYVQPKFRVVVGEYFSSMQAQMELMNVKQQFPDAMVVPDKVSIR